VSNKAQRGRGVKRQREQKTKSFTAELAESAKKPQEVSDVIVGADGTALRSAAKHELSALFSEPRRQAASGLMLR